MIKEFATWLAALVNPVDLPDLEVGDNLYVGWMPETATGTRVCVRELTPAPVQAEDSRIITKPLQILVVGTSHHAGRDLAQWIAEQLINRVSPAIDNDYEFMSIQGQEPYFLGENKKKEHEFAVNVTALVRRT